MRAGRVCCGLARASACHPGPHFVERAKGEDAVAGIDRLERRADESKTKRFLSSCFLRGTLVAVLVDSWEKFDEQDR